MPALTGRVRRIWFSSRDIEILGISCMQSVSQKLFTALFKIRHYSAGRYDQKWISWYFSKFYRFHGIWRYLFFHAWPGVNHIFYWLKVRSHQTPMTRIARMIYMLSQCKARQSDRQSCGAIRANEAARIERFFHVSRKIWTLADIRAALTNQELALAVTSLRAEAENPKQQWWTK